MGDGTMDDGGNQKIEGGTESRRQAVYLKPLALGVFAIPVVVLFIFLVGREQPDSGAVVFFILVICFMFSPLLTTNAFWHFNGDMLKPLLIGNLVAVISYCALCVALDPDFLSDILLLFPFLLTAHLLLSYGLFRLKRRRQ